MKVLHIFVNAFYSSGKGISGGDKRIIEFVELWTRNRKDVKIKLYAPNSFISLIKEDVTSRIETYDTSEPVGISGNLIRTYLYRTRRVRKLIKCDIKDENIFYSSSDFFPDILPAYKSANKYNARWCATVHHIIESPKTRPGNIIRNLIAYIEQKIALGIIEKKADRILVVSPLVKNYFLDNNVSDDKIYSVLNGVDVEYIDEIEPSIEHHYDGVFLARLAPSKGISELSDIWKGVCKMIPDAKLGIIGGGDDSVKEDILNSFKEKGIEKNVEILGYLDSREAYSILKSSKVFVFPSHEEGWGISIAEAMACRLPVVSYNLPVFPYVFPNLLRSVEIYDTKAFSDEILEILNDSNKQKMIGEKGYSFIDNNYTWSRAASVELDALNI